MSDLEDYFPEMSPFKKLERTFANMAEFLNWKRTLNFNWINMHRSHQTGKFEDNAPHFIHFRCNSCAQCSVQMRMNYVAGKDEDYHIEVLMRGTHGSEEKKMSRGLPPTMLLNCRSLLERGLKPSEVVRQIRADMNVEGIEDEKSIEQRLKQVQNLKYRMTKEVGAAGMAMLTMQQLRDHTEGLIRKQEDPVYMESLGKYYICLS
jgi:hypothetical protein